MNIVDAILIVILIIGALGGMRRGAVKSIVSLVGSIVVLLLSWILKGSLANILISKLPQIGNNAAVSVLVYHILSFILLLIVFSLLYRVLLKVTDIVEKVFDATIILGFVSRVIGAVIGAITTYVVLFFILFILSIFNIKYLNNSKVSNFMLEKTPALAPLVKNTFEGIKEVYESNSTEEQIKILFEKNIINEDNMNKILEKVN